MSIRNHVLSTTSGRAHVQYSAHSMWFACSERSWGLLRCPFWVGSSRPKRSGSYVCWGCCNQFSNDSFHKNVWKCTLAISCGAWYEYLCTFVVTLYIFRQRAVFWLLLISSHPVPLHFPPFNSYCLLADSTTREFWISVYAERWMIIWPKIWHQR